MAGNVLVLPQEFSLEQVGQPIFDGLESRVAAEGPISPVHEPFRVRYDSRETDLVVLKYSGRAGWEPGKLAQTSLEATDRRDSSLDFIERALPGALQAFLREHATYSRERDEDCIDRITIINAEWMRNVAEYAGGFARLTVSVYPDRVRVDAEQGGEPFDVLAHWKPLVPLQRRGYGFRIGAGLADELLLLDGGRMASYHVMRPPRT